jgi:hypothetical protein
MFRQQSALIAKKLAQKEEALDIATRESESLGRELEARVRAWGDEREGAQALDACALLPAVACQPSLPPACPPLPTTLQEAKLSELSGPKFMKRDEFKAYAANLRAKTATFKQLKQELADLRQETVIVARTEQLLKSRAGDIDTVMRRLEERRGVTGYTAVQVGVKSSRGVPWPSRCDGGSIRSRCTA